jgi:hypothetical protein
MGTTELDLSATGITDEQLAEKLKGLTQLKWLSLWNTDVTDAGLVHLKGLTNLKRLFLNDTGVTDVGLMHLKGLTMLEKLFLDGTQVTDAGLVHLKELTKLEWWTFCPKSGDALEVAANESVLGHAELERGGTGFVDSRGPVLLDQ